MPNDQAQSRASPGRNLRADTAESAASRSCQPASFESFIKSSQIAENLEFCDAVFLETKQRCAKPLNPFPSRLIASEFSGMTPGKAHLGERLVRFGNTGEYFTPVIGQCAPDGSDVLLEGLMPLQFWAKGTSK